MTNAPPRNITVKITAVKSFIVDPRYLIGGILSYDVIWSKTIWSTDIWPTDIWPKVIWPTDILQILFDTAVTSSIDRQVSFNPAPVDQMSVGQMAFDQMTRNPHFVTLLSGNIPTSDRSHKTLFTGNLHFRPSLTFRARLEWSTFSGGKIRWNEFEKKRFCNTDSWMRSIFSSIVLLYVQKYEDCMHRFLSLSLSARCLSAFLQLSLSHW